MELMIRPATDAEIDAIASLESEAFPFPWKGEFFRGEIRASGRFNRVVVDDRGMLAGYLFSMLVLDELHINKIAVRPELRRRGIARALMDECFDFARQKGVQLLSLEVRETNDEAREFYHSLSFRLAYRRPSYYPDGEAALVMTRTL